MAVVILALDQSVGYVARTLFFRTTDGDTGGQINGLLRSRAPAVIFGSSRAESHYVPSILQSALGEAVYNAGFKGSNAMYHFGLEQIVLETYRPSLIVYDYAAIAVAKDKRGPYASLEPLYPFRDSQGVQRLLAEQGPLAQLIQLSGIYPFNSKFHSLVLFNVIGSRPGVTAGYAPQYQTMQDALPPTLKWTEQQYDPVLIDKLVSFIESARAHGIPLVMVISPHRSYGTYPLPARVEHVLNRENIPVLDFNGPNFEEFQDHKLFRDDSHLNDSGARLFSARLAESLRQMFKHSAM